jgi:hypothetical protein
MIPGIADCKCLKSNNEKKHSGNKKLPLNRLLDDLNTITTTYPYLNKKLSYWSSQIAAIIMKIKEKKVLTNIYQKK